MTSSPIRVLVVDDSDVAEVTAELLGFYGFHVRAASSGHAGIEVAREFAPDVVLLDLAMPETDGIEVASILRASDRHSKRKIIAYSGYSAGAVYRAAQRAGFDKLICKPAPVEVLVDAICEVTATTANLL